MIDRCRILALALLPVLAACGNGTKLLKEPIPVELARPIAVAEDDRAVVALNWVVVRNGPGSWARNADWDEYRLSITNRCEQTLRIDDVIVVDGQGARMSHDDSRKRLVKASRQTVRRYKESDLRIRAGMSGAQLAGLGTAGVVAGGYAGAYFVGSALTSAFTGAGTTAAASAAGYLGMTAFIAAPVVLANGVIRANNNTYVAEAMQERSSRIPLLIEPGVTADVSLFYPLSPSPRFVEVVYFTEEGLGSVIVDTREMLDGLHLGPTATR